MDEKELLFGSSSANIMQEIEDIKKSLAVGYAMGTTDQTGFGATRVESLEQTLKMAIMEEKSAKFWKALSKGKANGTVEEFTTVNDIGRANFYVEGGIPEEYDEDIRREYENVKYIGAVGRVPLVATVTKSIVDNLALIKKLKALAIIRELNIKSIYANSANIPIEFNGFFTQFKNRVKRPSENIIDLRGKVLNASTLADIATIIQDNYGDPQNIQGWLSNDAFKNYSKEVIKDKTMTIMNREIKDIVSVPKDFEIGDGKGQLETDIFLKHRGQTHLDDKHPKLNSNKTAFAATHEKAPATLSGGTASLSIEVLSGSKLDADTYDYCVIPVNKYGAGAGFELKTNTVAENKKVVFTLADNGSASGREATCFEIYRKKSSDTGLSDYRYLKTVTLAG